MINIPQEKVDQRWDNLPEILREALFDSANANVISRLGEINKFSDEKIDNLSIIAGDVLFGFLKIDDFEKEIINSLSVSPEIAKAITTEINSKIFSPLKKDIDQAYIDANTEKTEAITKKPEENKSSITEIQPSVIKFEEIKPEPVSPINEVATSEAPVAFENIVKAVQQKVEEKPAMPFMLHQEEEVKPIVSSKKSLGGLFGLFSKKPQGVESQKTVVAQVDFGGEEVSPIDIPVSQKISTKKEENLKEIHYEQAEKEPFVFGGDSQKIVEQKPSEKLEMPSLAVGNTQIKTEEKLATPEIIKPAMVADKNLEVQKEIPKVVNFSADEVKVDSNLSGEKANPITPVSAEPAVVPKIENLISMPIPPAQSIKPTVSEPSVINNTVPKNVDEFSSAKKTELSPTAKINEPVKRVDFSEADIKKPEIEIKPITNNFSEAKPAISENKEINKNIEPIQPVPSVSQPISSPVISVEEKKPEIIPEVKPTEAANSSEAKPEDDIIDLRTFKIGK